MDTKEHRQQVEHAVNEAECARLTALSRTARYEMERRGEFPRRRKLTGRRVFWLYSEIAAWLQSREQGNAPEPAKATRASVLKRKEANEAKARNRAAQ